MKHTLSAFRISSLQVIECSANNSWIASATIFNFSCCDASACSSARLARNILCSPVRMKVDDFLGAAFFAFDLFLDTMDLQASSRRCRRCGDLESAVAGSSEGVCDQCGQCETIERFASNERVFWGSRRRDAR